MEDLNILIRTCGREGGFNNLINDISHQTIDKSLLKIYVSVDVKESYTKRILKKSGIRHQIIKVNKGAEGLYYNEYLNDLLDEVKSGWIFIADDDDRLTDVNALKRLHESLTDPDVIYTFRILFDGTTLLPYHLSGRPVENRISMSGFSIHSSKKTMARFKPVRAGDFHFINDIIDAGLPYRWLSIDPVVRTQNTGNHGEVKDVPVVERIYYFTPYSIDGNLGKEMNHYMSLIGDNDVAVFLDGDMMFLDANFGKIIDTVIRKNPLGVYSCLTNRISIGSASQLYKRRISPDPNVKNHKKTAIKVFKEGKYSITKSKTHVSQFLLAVPKVIWKEFPFKETGVLGVDTEFYERVKEKYPFYIMDGLYVFHYYRLLEGKKNVSHLRP